MATPYGILCTLGYRNINLDLYFVVNHCFHHRVFVIRFNCHWWILLPRRIRIVIAIVGIIIVVIVLLILKMRVATTSNNIITTTPTITTTPNHPTPPETTQHHHPTPTQTPSLHSMLHSSKTNKNKYVVPSPYSLPNMIISPPPVSTFVPYQP